MSAKLAGIKQDFKLKKRLDGWIIPRPESAFTPETHWSNYDMEPVPQEHWSWTTGTFAAYWFSDLINAGSWSQVSSFVALGLTWWQACLSIVRDDAKLISCGCEGVLATFTGGFLLSIVIAFNGIIGARTHTPFAVTSRAAYGYWLSRFAVVSRMVIAWFWFSVNTYQGGTGIKICLIAIWPSFRHFKNHLPASSGTDSQSMLCFFLFWLLQFPLCLIHPRKLRPIFLLKAVTLPVVAIAMMGWTIHKAGDQASAVMREAPKLSGLDAWCTSPVLDIPRSRTAKI
ncbi:SPOSA6832_04164 [Sporobolomyces salmonicolor]|uniref:SPOSA6832_04164-mRNA-1:cds n=1 Tax=Sporidiobolus salmonicolor TaxID=5005 RepID=A0A0D6ES13_SPOSA|nr:SPOSA6832_04164 [Sporobolomyces salmonicolor]